VTSAVKFTVLSQVGVWGFITILSVSTINVNNTEETKRRYKNLKQLDLKPKKKKKDTQEKIFKNEATCSFSC
jgi:hypothetical protein